MLPDGKYSFQRLVTVAAVDEALSELEKLDPRQGRIVELRFFGGLTIEEISQLLTQAASKYYNNVQVKVEVAEYASKFYEVFGTAVRDAGRKPYTGRNTVISALAAAGFNEDAWPQQVSVSRPAKNGQPRATAIIDMKQMYMTGDTRQNYLLEEGDIEEALTAASAIGDDTLQRQSTGHVVPDSFTHGTSEQRLRWFRKGFDTGDIREGDTFSATSL